MAVINTDGYSTSRPLISAATVATATPTAASDQYVSGDSAVMTYLSGTGSGTIRLWIWDGSAWFKGDAYDFAAANLPEVVQWVVPGHSRFTFQASAVTGGNITVTVK